MNFLEYCKMYRCKISYSYDALENRYIFRFDYPDKYTQAYEIREIEIVRLNHAISFEHILTSRAQEDYVNKKGIGNLGEYQKQCGKE